MGYDHPCTIEGIDTAHIKMFDAMVRELKEVRYVPQLKSNLISAGAWMHWVLKYLLEMVFSR